MMHYLNSGKNYERQDNTSLPVLPNTVLILLAKKMLSRLSCTAADGTESSSSASEEENSPIIFDESHGET